MADRADANAAPGEPATLRLHEEVPVPSIRRVLAGEVIVTTRVVTERRMVEVEVRREELVVEHVANREGAASDGALHPLDVGESRTIVLHADEIRVEAIPTVVEEVRITKELVEERREIETQARRETPTITRSGNVREMGGAKASGNTVNAPPDRPAGRVSRSDTAPPVATVTPGSGGVGGARSVAHDAGVADATGATLRLREDQLRVTKQRVEVGEVRLGKQVIEEKRALSVPVTREEVVIERIPGDGRPDPRGFAANAGQRLRIPVREDRVDVQTQTVTSQEAHVTKREVTADQQITVAAQREVAVVEKQGHLTAREEASAPLEGRAGP